MSTQPPPIRPSPDGWRQPGVLLPWVTPVLAVAGLMVSAIGAYVALDLYVSARQACELLDAGNRASFLLFLPPLVIGMWIVFALGVYISQSQPALLRFITATLLAVAVAFSLVSSMVPDSPPQDYRDVDHSEFPDCGPGGVPTWWPTWLPT